MSKMILIEEAKLKQALEALKMCRYLLEIEVNKAIARDAADAWVREKEAELFQHDAAITNLRTAIEAAEKQEPVAYIRTDRHGDTALEWDRDEDLEGAMYEYDPLYTTTPAAQRQWVGLNNSERLSIWEKAMLEDNGKNASLQNQPFVHYARAIEAKLKEKNGA